ncbi:class I adenylate-forming enzyme family protein [Natrarchaeobius sp. A-rgal3]|uniref:class I adenylate-forming enzyme family protein n=1 Tax=Natrarchaeobius versutus TaxID=1679078 RepID=UPI00350F2075
MTLSLARRADRFPDRTAIVDISEERLYAPAETIHEERVSYGELSEMADALADRLSALGIGAGDTVCLVTRNRVASLALLFACRRLEATLAPISHLLTPVTVERPFEALEPAIVVAEAAQRDLVRSIPFDRSVTLEELAETDTDDGIQSSSESDLRTGGDRHPRSDHPLLLVHGEGGRPVVAHSARTLEWNCISALVAWGISRSDVVPLVTPLSTYDGLVRVTLPILYAGGRLLLDRAFDPGDTLTAIVDESATLIAGRATAFRNLAAEPSFAEAVASLELAIPDRSVPADVLESYRDHDVSVSRAYGRLECSTAFCQPVDVDDHARGGDADGAIGLPVPDCRVRLFDDRGDVLEGPGAGRLRVGGAVVADGYVTPAGSADGSDGGDGEGIADRTNERDVDPDGTPDDDGPGRFVDGWFDTGEMVRRDEDGFYVLE